MPPPFSQARGCPQAQVRPAAVRADAAQVEVPTAARNIEQEDYDGDGYDRMAPEPPDPGIEI
jgi:hypothetical protein